MILGADEPRTVKAVQETPVVQEAEEVAMLPKVLLPVKYGMLPTTAAEDVERPLNERVAPDIASGNEVMIGAW